jgi:hypothetical protein
MISERKFEANRQNARASTGPRSEEAKQRSARNARRHGLAIPIGADPELAARAAKLARRIAGPHPGDEILKQRSACLRLTWTSFASAELSAISWLPASRTPVIGRAKIPAQGFPVERSSSSCKDRRSRRSLRL